MHPVLNVPLFPTFRWKENLGAKIALEINYRTRNGGSKVFAIAELELRDLR